MSCDADPSLLSSPITIIALIVLSKLRGGGAHSVQKSIGEATAAKNVVGQS